jgi:hypothetical protein
MMTPVAEDEDETEVACAALTRDNAKTIAIMKAAQCNLRGECTRKLNPENFT